MGHLNAIRFIKASELHPPITSRILAPDKEFHSTAERPIVCPNHGFVRQLEVFGHCDYDPPPSQASRQVESCIRGLDEPDHYIR